MLNNKGQSIVIFVLALPIILLFISYVYDIVNADTLVVEEPAVKYIEEVLK